MGNFKNIPIGLYIHLPWCIRKCPYCDFNSHEKKDFPEQAYIDALIHNFTQNIQFLQNRPLTSIFFGGGTPSLFSAKAIQFLLKEIDSIYGISADMEITLEANPGTLDEENFRGYREAGVNRLSIGVQSFNPKHLKHLGRIHTGTRAITAIETALNVGFEQINVDLMYGLPEQRVSECLMDLREALAFPITHLSWYQLTIEPNSFFYRYPPQLPDETVIAECESSGRELLRAQGFSSYEISAFSTSGNQCSHNLNYWQFGDYLGIGAGAHSKITLLSENQVCRFNQIKHPDKFLASQNPQGFTQLSDKALTFEFMLNALRLKNGFLPALFNERTGLPFTIIEPILNQAVSKGLLQVTDELIKPTTQGFQFLNDLTQLFLSD